MKKPNYISDMYALIFLCLGITFIAMGCLCFIGIMKPSAHSKVQNPITMGIVFATLGITFCIAQTVFRVISGKQHRLHKELLTDGIRLTGKVEKVYLEKRIQLGKTYPFRICYTYSHQGETYHHKSGLLWNRPDFREGDSIEVYANDFGKSALDLCGNVKECI